MKVYEALARAFVEEGTDTVFGLMGDGNMAWMARIADTHGVKLIHVRQEGPAVSAADGYALVTGRVGVCSVTSGPGLTNLATTLTASVRRCAPMVVFVGDTPASAAFNLQEFDQRPLVEATGAGWVRLRGADHASEDVAIAFARARIESRPIVLSVPLDVQGEKFDWEWDHRPSRNLIPPPAVALPDPDAVIRVAEALRAARRPVLIGGRGAARSAGSAESMIRIAEATGALLATTVRAKDLFHGHPHSAGIAGAFTFPAARELFTEADLVVAFGARMGYFTTEGGYLFPGAHVIQVDRAPVGFHEGQQVADSYVTADASLTAAALASALSGEERRLAPDIVDRLAADGFDEPSYDVPPGTVDPRDAIATLNDVLPPEALVVVGAGHFWNFVVPGMSGRRADAYEFTYDFGTVGLGLSTGIGAAVGDHARTVAVIEGDGGVLMNLQEIETIGRHGIPVILLVMNDGAYGAEVHKLAAAGLPSGEASFGMVDLAMAARGLGVSGSTVSDAAGLRSSVESFLEDPRPTVVDIRIAPNVLSAPYRRLHRGKPA